MDRRRRQQRESLERAGLVYLAREHFRPSADESAPPVTSTGGPSTTEPVDEPRAPLDEASKRAQLQRLSQEVANCARCQALASTRTQTVFSDGSPMAELCFVGEAPGGDEDRHGVPFVGKAGQLLTRIIEACQLQRGEVYICNVLKCRPPDNRNPQPDEVENCRPFLDRQLAILRPKILVALGKYAAAHLLGKRPEDVPITRMRGQVHAYNGIPFMITLHPAYLLRNPGAKKDVWDDMKEVMRRLGRPVE